MNKSKLFNRMLSTSGIAASLWFSWLVMKSYYEPTYPDAIQYKASTVAPVYSGFDMDKDSEIDMINVYRCRAWGYINENLTSKDPGFYDIKKILDDQRWRENMENIYSGERLDFPVQ